MSKILIWDIETAPLITAKFLHDKNPYINHNSIQQDWFIICGAWKFAGDKKVQTVAINKVGDDFEVVKKLREVIASADIVVHHNGDKFDIKSLNTRLIYHNLPPLPQVASVDTLKEVKKIACFSSNKLDYLSKFLLGEGKMHVDFSLWLDILKGNKTALKKMVEYNKVDVIRLEEVYLRLKPYMKTHPHIGVLNGKDRKCSCAKCGSEKLKRNGIRITAAGLKKQEVQCMNCGSYARIAIEK